MSLKATIDSWNNNMQGTINEVLEKIAHDYTLQSQVSFPQLVIVIGDNWYSAAVYSNGIAGGHEPGIPTKSPNSPYFSHFNYGVVQGYIPLRNIIKIIEPLPLEEAVAIVPVGQGRQKEIVQLGGIESNTNGWCRLNINGKILVIFRLSPDAQASPKTA